MIIFNIKKGEAYSRVVEVYEDENQTIPRDLSSGYSSVLAQLRPQIESSEKVDFSYEFPVSGNNHVRLSLSKSTVDSLSARRWILDMFLIPDVGDPVAVIRQPAEVIIIPNVSR